MTLSWGHRPPELEPPPRPSRIPHIVAAAFVAIVAVAGFIVARPSTVVDDPARVAIAGLLEQQRKALVKGDLNAYLATLDPSRVSLRTCEEQRFEIEVAQKMPVPSYTLGRTDTYKSYVRAWVSDLTGWRRVFVRNDGGHWYLTEPSTADLGPDVTREFAGIRVTAKEAEADLIDAVGHDLSSVRDAVVRYAPTPPTKLFSIWLSTLAAANGKCFFAGTALPTYDGARLTLIDITLNPDYASLSLQSTNVLMHEALHWIQFEHSLDAVDSMDWWLMEGWPYRIADDPSGGARSSAVCSPSVPAYRDTRNPPSAGTSPIDVERHYVIGAMLVERLGTQYGPSAYWQLVDAFAKDPDPDRAYKAAFGTDGATFYRAWLTDMQAHYC